MGITVAVTLGIDQNYDQYRRNTLQYRPHRCRVHGTLSTCNNTSPPRPRLLCRQPRISVINSQQISCWFPHCLAGYGVSEEIVSLRQNTAGYEERGWPFVEQFEGEIVDRDLEFIIVMKNILILSQCRAASPLQYQGWTPWNPWLVLFLWPLCCIEIWGRKYVNILNSQHYSWLILNNTDLAELRRSAFSSWRYFNIVQAGQYYCGGCQGKCRIYKLAATLLRIKTYLYHGIINTRP